MSQVSPDALRGMEIIVVGGGLGGLAAALRLRAAGASVLLLEKNDTCGGKLAEFRDQGFRWDMGPSLLTMPEVLHDLFQAMQEPLSDHLVLERLENTCRYFWRHGQRLDEDAAFFSRPEVKEFLGYARGIYELSGEAFLRHPPEEMWRAFRPSHWHKLVHLPKVMTWRTLAQEVNRRFRDPALRQLFQRFATYNGSDPFQTPATFNVIPYVEAAFGAWYIRGGMRQLAVVLEKLARQRGVEVRTGCQVTRFDCDGLHLQDGQVLRADRVVINGDVIRAHRDWIRLPGWEREAARLERPPRSSSGLVWLVGLKGREDRLSHHNILFSEDYRREFRQIFQDRKPPDDPTIYISITSRTDLEDAPEQCENWFVLVNMPAEIQHIDWGREGPRVRANLLKCLRLHGFSGVEDRIVIERLWTPADFAARDLSTHGALYGWASHSPWTSLIRPPMRSRLDRRLWFVGGTTHPGGGIPLVLLSAAMVVEGLIRTKDQAG